MAYRRKTRRAPRRKRRTNRRLSKHMVRAIKAISQQPVETKAYAYTVAFDTLLVTTGYAGGVAHTVQANIFSDIPRLKDTLTKTENSFIGNKIQSRGLRFQINVFSSNAAALSSDCLFRFTVYKQSVYIGSLVSLASSSTVFDQSQTTSPTWAMWNTQRVNIIFQRKFRLAQLGQINGIVNRKFWVPLRKQVEATEEESTAVNTYMGEVKGMQYYWVLEILSPGNPSTLTTSYDGYVNTKVYFKDA